MVGCQLVDRAGAIDLGIRRRPRRSRASARMHSTSDLGRIEIITPAAASRSCARSEDVIASRSLRYANATLTDHTPRVHRGVNRGIAGTDNRCAAGGKYVAQKSATRDTKLYLDRAAGLSRNSHPGHHTLVALMHQAAEPLSPRRRWRNRASLRRRASGRSVVYNLRFPGQYYDQETGLNYNYYRDYDPNLGRYIESDPIGLIGGSWSTYGYVNGEPLTLADSTGLAPHDSFPSPEAAAIDALKYISSKPDRCKTEYGGYVYKEWSLFGPPTYTYDEPTGLGQTGGAMPALPVFHLTYADFHNHPLLPGYDYNHYSPPDKDGSDALNIPGYLLTPTGPILRYTPVPGRPEGGNVSQVGQSDCACKR
jgi:RHS repeat-associated protein